MGKLNFLKSLQPHKMSYDVSISTVSQEVSRKERNNQNGSKQPMWKCRYVIVLAGFCIYFCLNAYRITTSINLVAMVNSSAIAQQTEVDSISCPHLKANVSEDSDQLSAEKEGEFVWSPQIQGYILGCYFVGYSIVPIPIGNLIERFGCKWFLCGASFITAVATLLTPVFSKLSAFALMFLQILRGSTQGVVSPSMTLLIANWFPKQERGTSFTIMQSGCALGSFLGSLFAGFLCASEGGWPSSFYTFGAAGMLLSIAILFFVTESPTVHSRISKAELDFILSNQETTLSRKRPKTPWREMLTSVPVYAAGYGCFGQQWAMSQFMLVHSTFLGTILHYPISQNGLLSAVPFLLQFLATQIAGVFSSFMLRKNIAGVDFLRKFCGLISCLGYSGCLFGIYLAGCDRTLSTIFSMSSVAFSGFGFAGTFIVAADMSPTFAGSVMAICCASACLSSVFLPLIVGYLTDEMQTIEQWNKVFFITIGVVLSSAIVFAVFGSAEVQPWNYVEENETDAKSESPKYDEECMENKKNFVNTNANKNGNEEIKVTRF